MYVGLVPAGSGGTAIVDAYLCHASMRSQQLQPFDLHPLYSFSCAQAALRFPILAADSCVGPRSAAVSRGTVADRLLT
jgi:hypothetical protein